MDLLEDGLEGVGELTSTVIGKYRCFWFRFKAETYTLFHSGATVAATLTPPQKVSKVEDFPSFSSQSPMGGSRDMVRPTYTTTNTATRTTSTVQAARCTS